MFLDGLFTTAIFESKYFCFVQQFDFIYLFQFKSNPEDKFKNRNIENKFKNLLGPITYNKYFYGTSTNLVDFTRGHLAPKADFIYGSQQLATFYYVNASPQFSCFNNQNWGSLEEYIRDIAYHNNQDLLVYTGTYVKKIQI